jgi:NAD(P)-dependent dehydrogenase (short-subunit alcohol dehydrogenase family)
MAQNISPDARTVVITGGGTGIGRAVACLCAARGDRVTVLDRDQSAAEQTSCDALKLGAAGAIALVCDVRFEDQVERALEKSAEQFGVPSALLANAGIDIGGLIHELPLEIWQQVMDVNLTGVFLTCKHVLRQMLAAGIHGSIVCTSSPNGFVALAGGAVGAYSATKAGISALVRCMAIDYAKFGIRVNAIVPGATETRLMWQNVADEQIPRMRDQLNREIPLGRLGQPEDIARAIVWLFSDDSRYVTGSQMVCDGGILAKSCISV